MTFQVSTRNGVVVFKRDLAQISRQIKFAFLGVAKSCCIVKYLGSSCNVPGEEPKTSSETGKDQEPFHWNT